MTTFKKSQSGFSLVELLVAVMILAVGLLGLAELQITAMKANSQSATATAAAALAQQAVEEIASLPSDNAMFADGESGTLDSSIDVQGAGSYDVTYTVSQVQADGVDVTNLFLVNITVSSTTDLMHVLGKQERIVTATTLKRAI